MIYSIYILFNKTNTVNYTGVTNDLVRRIWEHKHHDDLSSFTARYNITKLVYFEDYENIQDAIEREKEIKTWGRRKKLALINIDNSELRDLALEWPEFQDPSLH